MLKFKVWQNGAWEILRLIYRIAKFSKCGLSGVWAEFWGFWLYKTRRTDYWMRNLWIFLFLLGFFMAHYAHFKFRAFLWLATLIFCVARLFVCGVGFLRDGFCEADGSALTRCFKATRWILRFWEFLEFVMNFKEFLVVHRFFGFWFVVWFFWVFAHFLCLWRVAFSLI